MTRAEPFLFKLDPRSGVPVLSAAMLLRHSLHLEREAACIEQAVAAVLSQGARTADLAGKTHPSISTADMGSRVVMLVKEVK